MDHYTFMDLVCVVTAAVVPFPALYDTIKALWTRELPAHGRRPEPTVAALLGNAAWFLFGCTENQREPLRLNAWGGAVQIAGLVAFLVLCTRAERMQALRGPILLAAIYLALTIVFGVFFNTHLDVYQWVCTIAGLVAAAAPLLTFLFLTEKANDEMLPLPHWVILAFYATHCLLWFRRGVSKKNNYMLCQNLLGLVCSTCQLFLLICPGLPDMWREEDGEDILGGHLGDMQPPAPPQGIVIVEPLPTPTEMLQIITVQPSGTQNVTNNVHLSTASERAGSVPRRRSVRLASRARGADKTPSNLTMVLRSSARRDTPTSGGESSSRTANIIPSGSKRKGPVTRETATPGGDRHRKSRRGDDGQRVRAPNQ